MSTMKNAMLEDIRTLVAIPSMTDTPEVSEALLKTMEICQRMGFRTKVMADDTVGYAEIGEGEELIGILAHVDVVPPGGEWSHDPFDMIERDGKIYGRGVFDDKGPMVCAMYAMKDLLEEGVELKKRIRLIVGTHEEEGDWDDIDYYNAHEDAPTCGFTPDGGFPVTFGEKGLLRADFILDAEGSGFSQLHGGEQINIVPDAARGVLSDGTELTASGRAVHASVPEEGSNAIAALMEQAAALDVPFARFYMEKFGWTTDGSLCGLGFQSETGGNTTLNVGCIDLIDGKIIMQVDIRFCSDYRKDQVLQALRESLEPHGMEIVMRLFAEPVYVSPESPMLQAIHGAYVSVTGDHDNPPQAYMTNTYAPGMANMVAFGPLLPGRENTAHQVDESFPVEDLETARAVYRQTLKNLLEI